MTKVGLTSAINASFIQRLTGLSSKGGSSASSLAGALNGQGSSSVRIGDGLRLGARAFGNAVSGINSVINVLGQSKDILTDLGDITDRLIDLAERAARAGTGNSVRRSLHSQFKKIGKEFLDVLEDAEYDTKNILDASDLEEIFAGVGIEREVSEQLSAIFETFILNDDNDLLVDDEIDGERPLRIPPDAYKVKSPGSGGGAVDDDFTGGPVQVTNSAITNGAIATGYTIYEDDDGGTSGFNGTPTQETDAAINTGKIATGFSVWEEGGGGGSEQLSDTGSQVTDSDIVTGKIATGYSVYEDNDGGGVDELSGTATQVTDSAIVTGGIATGYSVYEDDDGDIQTAQITDAAITTGSIATGYNVYQDDNGSGQQTIKIYDGTSTATLTVTSDATLMSVNESTGYSVIKSSEDFLGYNTGLEEQLFIVDETGAVVQQVSRSGGTFGDGTFLASSTFSTNRDPSETIAVDLDSDGVLDLIIAGDNSTNDTEVLFGNGNGTFEKRTQYNFNAASLDIAVQDFNQDGKVDVVGLSDSGSYFTWFAGNGNGTFSAPGFFNKNTTTWDIEAADVNGDGLQDVVVSDYFGGTADIYIGNGNGTFDALSSYYVSVGATEIELADFDQDGELDLVLGTADSHLAILLGNGNGTFKSRLDFDSGSSATFTVKAADVNGDGQIDLATVDQSNDTLDILLGNGNGTFRSPISSTTPTGGEASAVISGDYNGDGVTDMAVSNYANNSTSVFIGNGNGTFEAASTFAATGGAWSLESGDFNGDGVTDLLTSGYLVSDTVSILLGNGTSVSATNGTFSSADISEDNKTVIYTVSDGTNNYVYEVDITTLGENPNTSTSTQLDTATVASGTTFSQAQISNDGTYVAYLTEDSSGNGSVELKDTATHTSDSYLNTVTDINYFGFSDSNSLFLAKADGALNSIYDYRDGAGFLGTALSENLAIDDFDTLEQEEGSLGYYGVYSSSRADGTFQTATFSTNTVSGNDRVYYGDFDGDGNLDLVGSDQKSIRIAFGCGDGTFASPINYITNALYDVKEDEMHVIDLNNDGYDDIVSAVAGNYLHIALSNGNGTFTNQLKSQSQAKFLRSGDMDGDGNVDLVYNNTSGTTVEITFGQGDGTFSGTYSYTMSSTTAMEVLDVDQDGILDIIANGSFYQGNGDGTHLAGQSLGYQSVREVADFNEDGIVDLFNGSVLLGNGNGTYAQGAAITGTDQLVADLDYDGDMDVLAFTTSGSVDVTRYLNDGTGNFTSTDLYGFTTPTDLLWADFTGDGFEDILTPTDQGSGRIYVLEGNGNSPNYSILDSNGDTHTSASLTSSSSVDNISLARNVRGELEFGLSGILPEINSDTDTELYRYSPNYKTIKVTDGTTTNTLAVTADAELMDINEATGYSVIKSTEDFLGHNLNNLEQFFLVDNTGTVVQQVTNLNADFSDYTDSAIAIGAVAADFTGDGIIDIMGRPTTGSSTAYLYEGLGDGSFAAGVDTIFTPISQQLVTGDFNNDGIADVASQFSIHLGNGNGTFVYGTSTSDKAAKAADLNGDGNVDFIGATGVMLGNGNGTFKAHSAFGFANLGISSAVMALDVDGDSDLDIIDGSSSFGNFNVFLSNGNGTFAYDDGYWGESLYVGGATNFIIEELESADFNGDGFVDIVATTKTGTTQTGRLNIFYGNGNGTFNEGIELTASADVYQDAVVDDFNGDGNYDIISKDFNLYGNGNGTFIYEASTYSLGVGGEKFLIDVNGDGRKDIFSAGTSADNFRVSLSGSETLGQISVSSDNKDFVYTTERDGTSVYHTAVGTIGESPASSTTTVVESGIGHSISQVEISNDGSYLAYLKDSGMGQGGIELKDTASFTSDSFLNSLSTISDFGFSDSNSLFLVQPDGEFKSDVYEYADGDGALGAAIAQDITFDGFTTLEIGSGVESYIGFYESFGDGTFSAGTFLVGGAPSYNVQRRFSFQDFNNDGITDLLGGAGGGGFFQAGNGNGTFKAYISSSGISSEKLVADINSDGNLDVVISNRLAFGNGNGTFLFDQIISATTSSHSFDDVNGDGVLDVISRTPITGGIVLSMGNGNGTFTHASSGPTFTAPVATSFESMDTGDFNGDGITDVVFGETRGTGITNSVYTLLGNGNGTFGAASTFNNILETSGDVFTADMDGDGSLDIVINNFDASGSNDGFSIMFGNGNGTFGAAVTTYTTLHTVAFDIADFNGDGTLDIAHSSLSGQRNIHLGNGNGTFSVDQQDRLPLGGNLLKAIDLNQDGVFDLFSGSGTSHALLLGNAGGTTYTVQDSAENILVSSTLTSGNVIDSISLARDSNGDPNVGLSGVLPDFTADSDTELYRFDWNSTPGTLKTIKVTNGVTTSALTVTADAELMAVNEDTGYSVVKSTEDFLGFNSGNEEQLFLVDTAGVVVQQIDVWAGIMAAGSFANELPFDADTGFLTVGDFDGDGTTDIITEFEGGSTPNSIYFGNGNGTFSVGGSNLDALIISPDDFNGDGILDVISYNNSTNNVTVQIGNGNGTFSLGQAIFNETRFDAGIPHEMMDLNNDGNLDVLLRAGLAPESIYTLLGNSNGTFSIHSIEANSSILNSSVTAYGDFNDDGNIDLIGNAGSAVGFYYGNGNGTFTDFVSEQSFGAISLTVNDFNNDGIDDFVFGGAVAAVRVRLGNGNGTFSYLANHTLTGTDEIDSYDLNGDGFVDLVGIDTSGDRIAISLGNGNGTFSARVFKDTGVGPDSMTFADFNDDGVTDIATSNSTDNDVSIFLQDTSTLSTTGGSITSVSVSTDNKSFVVTGNDGTTEFVSLFEIGSLGENPSSSVATILDTATIASGTTFSQAQISNDGSYLAYIKEDATGSGTVELKDTATHTSDSYLNTVSDVNYIGFSDSNSLFIAKGDGSLNDVYEYTDGDGALGSILADNLNISDFSTLEIGAQTNSYFSYSYFNNDGTFDAVTSITPNFTNTNPGALLDFNNDGLLDYLGDGSFFAGNGNGTFDARISSANTRNGNAFGDLDGDGILDGVSTTGVHIGNGNGTFAVGQTSFSISSTYSKMIDVDGDGNLDVVSVGSGTTVDFYLGNGNGTLAAPQTFNVASSALALRSLDVRDVTGDGELDIIVGDASLAATLNEVHVLTGNGNGTFQSAASFAVATNVNISTLKLSDIDSDGNLDIVTQNTGASDSYATLLGNGNGTFSASLVHTDVGSGITLDVADINGDGFADLYRSNETNGLIHLGNGNGTFGAGTVVTSSYGKHLSFTDLDQDGVLDLFSLGVNQMEVALGNGSSAYTVFDNTGGAVGSTTFTSGNSINDISLARDASGDLNLGLAGILPEINSDPDRELYRYAWEATSGTLRQIKITDGTTTNTLAVTVDATLMAVNEDTGYSVVKSTEDFLGFNSANAEQLFLVSTAGAVIQQISNNTTGASYTSVSGSSDDKSFVYTAEEGAVSKVYNTNVGTFGENPTSSTTILLDSSPQGDGTFTNSSTETVLGARGVAVGDINGDGFLDFATGNANYDNVSIRINQGDGTFANLGEFNVGDGPHELSLADVNGDGKLDLGVVNYYDNTVSILIGNGNGTFSAASAFSSNSGGIAMTRGDFNQDGNDDFMVANLSGFGSSLLLSNGNGTLSAPTNVFSGAAITDVTTGDFNGDGVLDIAVSDSTYDRASVAFGNGNGTFSIGLNYSVGGEPRSIQTGDINNDGITDLVTANFGGDNVSVVYGNGNGTFSAAVNTAVGNGSTDVAVGDFNGDGVDDIVVGHTYDADFEVYLNDGSGTLTFDSTYTPAALPNEIAVADFNGDGVSDLVVTNEGNVGIYTGDAGPAATFSEAQISNDKSHIAYFQTDVNGAKSLVMKDTATETTDTFLAGVANIDYFGFSDDDKVFFAQEAGGSYNIFQYTYGAGTLSAPIATGVQVDDFATLELGTNTNSYFAATSAAGGDGTFTAASNSSTTNEYRFGDYADLNNDGNLDFVATDDTNNQVGVFLGNGNGTFSIASEDSTVRGYSVELADLNGDGNIDFVLSGNETSGDTYRVRLGNGNGTFAGEYEVVSHNDSRGTDAVDVNNDGKLDLLGSHRTAGGGAYQTVSLGNGDGTFDAFTFFDPTGSDAGRDLEAADFNNDGILDVALGANRSGGISGGVVLGNGNGTFHSTFELYGAGDIVSMKVADLDGDGNMDLIGSTEDAYNGLSVFRGNGNGTFSAEQTFDGSTAGTSEQDTYLELRDFNNDGMLDAIRSAPSAGKIDVFLGNGNGTFQAPSQLDQAAGVSGIMVADFDNDGLEDVISFNDTNSVYSFFQGNSDGNGVSFRVFDDTGTEVLTDTFTSGNSTVDISLARDATNNPNVGLAGALPDIASDPDTELYRYVYVDEQLKRIKITDGTTTNSLAVTVDAQLVAVNESNGYSLVKSTEDFLGYNSGNEEQLFLVDTSGTVVQQVSGAGVGVGDGTFAAGEVVTPAAAFDGLVAQGDFNGDGIEDIAGGHFGDYMGSLLLGNGNGTFAIGTGFSASVLPISYVKTEDFNNDGELDLLAAGNVLSILIGNGNGTFVGGFTNFYSGNISNVIGSQDINGDGNIDLVGTSPFPYMGNIEVALGNGDGTFGAQMSFDTSYSSSITASSGDVDGDGKLDLAVVSYGSNSLDILIGNGNGTFKASVNYNHGWSAHYLNLMDVDGDGELDVVGTDSGSAFVSVGNGNGTFAQASYYTMGPDSDPFIMSADLNGDSLLDLYSVGFSGGGQRNLNVIFGNGNGTFTAQTTVASTYTDIIDVKSGDYNQDGIIDFAFADKAGDVQIFLGNGTPGTPTNGTFTNATITDDNSSVLYTVSDGTNNKVYKVDIASLGVDPSTLTSTEIDTVTVASGDDFGEVKYSNDGTYYAYQEIDSGGNVTFHFKDTATATDDAFLATVTDLDYFGFSDSNQLFIARDTGGGSYNVYQYTYGDGALGTAVVSGLSITDFDTAEIGTKANSYFAISAANGVFQVYDDTGTAVQDVNLGAGNTINNISLARNASGGIETGVFGTLPGINSDSDAEYYRYTNSGNGSTGTGDPSYKSLSRLRKEFESVIKNGSLLTRADAYQTLSDLEALKEQIDTNLELIGDVEEMLFSNIDLVREVGLSLLQLSDQVSDDAKAEEVARKLRSDIRRAPQDALNQLVNLENITVSALLADPETSDLLK